MKEIECFLIWTWIFFSLYFQGHEEMPGTHKYWQVFNQEMCLIGFWLFDYISPICVVTFSFYTSKKIKSAASHRLICSFCWRKSFSRCYNIEEHNSDKKRNMQRKKSFFLWSYNAIESNFLSQKYSYHKAITVIKKKNVSNRWILFHLSSSMDSHL